MTRGDIIWTGNKHHHFKRHGTVTSADQQIVTMHVDLEVTSNMSPKSKFLIYYIRDDGETVADSIEFKVARCLQNQVDYKHIYLHVYTSIGI